MLNVLLLAPAPPSVGGIANWTNMVLKYFRTSDNVFLDAINVGTSKKESFKMNIFERVFYGLQDCRLVIREMKEKFRNSKYAIVHFTTTGSLSLYRDRRIIRLARKHHIPIVMHIRNGRFPDICKKNGIEWKIFKQHFKLVNKIITIDKNTFDCVHKQCPEKTSEILNPIDTTKINDIALTHEFNGVITFVGWVVKTKGIEELIRAFAILKKKHKLIRLQIVGPYNTDYYNYLQNEFDVSCITFTGPLNNKECLDRISRSEIFVFPSYTEGCPNVILEAMLCKTPIVASKVGSIPELLDNDCGLLIEKENVRDIVEKVSFLLENKDLQTKYISNAFNKVTNELSIAKVANKYLELWKNIQDV